MIGLGLALAAAPSAGAQVGWVPVAVWAMDDPGRTLVDNSANALHGSVGPAVRTGVVVGDGVGHRFPGGSDVDRGRLDEVPDDPRLDPGTRDFAVTVRLRTTQHTGNIVQKGQARTTGGYFKMETTNGRAYCVFRGSGGTVAVGSGVDVTDGAWHFISCERVGNTVTMSVDWRVTSRKNGATGRIDNDEPLTIGGKPHCNQKSVDCDYFAGVLDVVRLDVLGPVPPAQAPQPAGAPVVK